MALDFVAASTQYVSCADDPTLNMGSTTDFSIVIRLFPDLAGDYPAIIDKRQVDGQHQGYVFQLNSTTGKPQFAMVDDGGDSAGVIADASCVGAEHCIIITIDRDSATGIKMYVDASIQSATGNPTAVGQMDNASPLAFAKKSYSPAGCYFDGRTIEARIYKGKILSQAEVDIITYSKGADNIVDGLVGRWLMNEKPDGTAAAGASSVIDVSGNGNHGTPYNSPIYRAAPVRLIKLPVLLTPISGHFERTFTETLILTDTVSKKTAKTFTETLHLTDTFSKAIKYYRTFTEKITLTDTVKVTKTNLVNLIKKLIQLMDIRRW